MTETIPVHQGISLPDAAPGAREASRSRGFVWWGSAGAFIAFSAVCAWFGYYTTFNSFAGWDDEGTLLLAVKDFAHHGGLYTHVYSSFGPFYFEALSTIFAWLPVTPDNGRVATLVVTLLTSLGLGIAVRIFTRSLVAGIATQVGSFVLLILSYVDESMHPMMLVWLLFAVALVALALFARGYRSIGCIILGAALAALVLTVVNVGTFAAIALLFTALTTVRSLRDMRLVRAAAATVFIGTPFLLIVVSGGLVSQSWIAKYCLVVAFAAAGIVVVTRDRTIQGLLHGRDVIRFLLSGGITAALIIVIAIASGTRPVDLVRGLFLDPARFSNGFTIPLGIPVGVVAWGAICLGGAALYHRYGLRLVRPGLDPWVHMAAGLLILYCALQEDQLAVPNSFVVGLPLLFFAAVPPVGTADSERIARIALVALATLEGLLAYPVAGAQVRWSSLLMIPVGMICLNDGVRQLHPLQAITKRSVLHVTTGVLASAVILAAIGWFTSVFVGNQRVETRMYSTSPVLELPGTHLIHLPTFESAPIEALAHAIHTQCSFFVTLPAMNSLYFWSGEEAPPDWTNTWFYTSNTAQQQELIKQITGNDRSRFCVVDNQTWLSFWYQGHAIPQLPLARLVEKFRQDNSPPTIFGSYRLFVAHNVAS